MRKWISFPLIVLGLTACSSMDEEETDATQAHYAAYAADGFTYYTPATPREKNKIIFYHKHCQLVNDFDFFSPPRSDYECEDKNR